MGQKINPNSFRLQVTKNWKSKWFRGKKDYAQTLQEDLKLRKAVAAKLGTKAGVAKIEIERTANSVTIFVYTAKPGVVIGRGGQGIDELRTTLEKLVKAPVKVSIMEVKNPETIAPIVAANIAAQLEKRISYRRALRQGVEAAMRAGAAGIKIQVSGRLGGSDMSRRDRVSEGRLPLQTLRSDIDYAHVNAHTTYGVIGVKVWICRGSLMSEEQKEKAEEAKRFKEVFGLSGGGK